MAFFKSVFAKPDASVVAGVAAAGSVFAVYQLSVGPVSGAHASDANHPSLDSSRRKAGYMAFLLVSGLTLLTRDSTLGELGYTRIVGMELVSRHAIMVSPQTGQIVAPGVSQYTMAGEQYTDSYGADQAAA